MFGLVFILAGIGCLFIAFVVYQQTKHFTENVKSVSGKIVEIKIREFRSQSGTSRVHQPIIQYEYEGKKWQFQSEYDVRSHHHQIGTTVFVYINPQHPTLVGSAEDISAHQLLMVIFAGLGLMLSIGGINGRGRFA